MARHSEQTKPTPGSDNTFKSARRQRVETGDTAEHHLEEFLSQRRMEVWESKGIARRENCLKEASIALEWGQGEQAVVCFSCCISLVKLRPPWAWSRWRRQCGGRCQQTFNGQWWCRWWWPELLYSSNWHWQPAKGHWLFPGLLPSGCSTGEDTDSWVRSDLRC